MTFLSPIKLLLLIPIVVIGIAYAIQAVRRKVYVARFTNLSLLSSVAPRRPQWWRRHVPAALLLLSLIALVVSLARPVSEQKVPKERATVILAIDVSNSMAATDVSPSRLEAAKSGALAFVGQLPPRLQLGLVTFAGTATLQVPATTDRQEVRDAISNLQLGPATAIGDAVYTSLDAIQVAAKTDDAAKGGGSPPPARIVLLSDGETTQGRSNTSAAEAARNASVPVDTIAYGTQEGTVEIQGQSIPVPVNVSALQALASQTNGKSYRAESAGQLKDVYQNLGSSIGYDKKQRETGRAFLGVGLALALIAAALSVLWTSRLP